MGKRHPNLPAWQWRAYPNNHQHPTNLVLHLIAVPLFIVAFLLIACGVFGLNLANFAIGVIGVIAAWIQLDEVPNNMELTGMILIAFALVLISIITMRKHQEVSVAQGQE